MSMKFIRRQLITLLHDHGDNDLIDKWNNISFIFDNTLGTPEMEWFQFITVCKNVMDFTLSICQLPNFKNLSDIWINLLTMLNTSGKKMKRTNYKSASKNFPLSLKAIQDYKINGNAHMVLNINHIFVIDDTNIANYTENDIDIFVEKYDHFFTRVYGHNLGKRITKIWTLSSSTISLYAENNYGDIIGLTSAIFMTMKDGMRYAWINGLAVDPELSGRGIAIQLIEELYRILIHSEKNLNGVIFCVQDGNSNMDKFMIKYQNRLPPHMQSFIGKSMFIKEQSTFYVVPLDNNMINILPTIEEIDELFLESAKVATLECGKSVATFYVLAANSLIRGWFHSTMLGQLLQ